MEVEQRFQSFKIHFQAASRHWLSHRQTAIIEALLMDTLKKLTRIRFPLWTALLALDAAALLAYGLYLGWLGFYWDDWIWMYFSGRFGAATMLQIDRAYRPLAGVVLWLGSALFGENPLGWQVYNLALRLLTAIAFWWFLRRTWPKHGQQAAWAALLFLVYPGFTHQFVAVNSSRHIAPYALFLVSLGCTAAAIRDERRSRGWTWAALITSLLAMLTSEYFYGLELTRLLVIWLAMEDTQWRERLRRTFRRWLPYLLLVLTLFAWRFWVSQSYNYEVSAVDELVGQPLQGLWLLLRNLFSGIYHTLVSAWGTVLQFPNPAEWGSRVLLYYWVIVSLSALALFVYLLLLQPEDERHPGRRFSLQAVLLGGAALLAGGLPFLVTQLSIEASFPNNRALLPMTFGAALLLIGLLDLIPARAIKVALLTAALGLVMGRAYYTALEFKLDWTAQQRFFQQLSWRAPGIRPGTALLTVEMPVKYSSDNSLSGPLNQFYTEQAIADGELPYLLYYLDLRLGREKGLQSLEADTPIEKTIHLVQFEGSTSQAVVLYYDPPGCLRLLDPGYDQYLPDLPPLLQEALPLSDLSLVSPHGESAAAVDRVYGPGANVIDHCYYVEKADLLRQSGDWYAIVGLAREVDFQEFERPAELVPFIQAYAHTGDLVDALALTEMAAQDPQMHQMLCHIWTQLVSEVPLDAGHVAEIEFLRACQID